MGIKQLQQQYKEGKITKAQYIAALKELQTAGTIEQEDYDEAASYDPEAEKPIYTQADVDGFIAKKATQQIKKICRDAGIDVEGVTNKDLAAHVTTVLKTGAGKPGDNKNKGDEGAQTAKITGLTQKVKELSVELMIYKNLGTDFKPVNANQVVRAIKSDYMDFIDVDEDGETVTVDRKSINRALQKVKDAEPNLFSADEDDYNPGGGKGDEHKPFSGKAPGGGTKTVDQKAKDYERLKAEGLEAMGVKKDTTK